MTPLLTLIALDHGTAAPADHLVLPFDRRQRSRLRVTLRSGREAVLHLERGTILRGGDRLAASSGEVVLVEAAPEPVAVASANPGADLARIAYHLGNRHVPLEIGEGWVRFEQDHVLEDMVRGLGAEVTRVLAPFEPESGAYGGGHHGHDHDHGHDHHHHHG